MDVKDKNKKNVCLYCLKEQNANNHSKCSQCRIAVYCNVVCQRAHWKVHKLVCRNSNDEEDDAKLFNKCKNCIEQNNYVLGEKLFKKFAKTKSAITVPQMEFEAIQGIATCHQNLGKFESAIQLSRDVLAKRREFYKNDNHHFVLNSETNLAQALVKGGRLKDAEDIVRVTYEKKKRILGEQHIDTNICRQALQSCLTLQKKFDDCIQFQANLSEKAVASDASDLLISIQAQAIALGEQKKFFEVKQLLTKGLDLAKENMDLNEIKQAETYLRSSLKKRQAFFGKHSNDALLSMLELGKNLKLSSQLDESFDLLTAFVRAMEKQNHKPAKGTDNVYAKGISNVNIAKKTIAEIYIEREEFIKAETLLHETIEAKYYDFQLAKDMPANFPWRKNEVKATPPPLPNSNSKKDDACLQFLLTMGIHSLNAHADGIQLVDCLEESYQAQGKFEEAQKLLSWLGLNDDRHINLFKAITKG